MASNERTVLAARLESLADVLDTGLALRMSLAVGCTFSLEAVSGAGGLFFCGLCIFWQEKKNRRINRRKGFG